MKWEANKISQPLPDISWIPKMTARSKAINNSKVFSPKTINTFRCLRNNFKILMQIRITAALKKTVNQFRHLTKLKKKKSKLKMANKWTRLLNLSSAEKLPFAWFPSTGNIKSKPWKLFKSRRKENYKKQINLIQKMTLHFFWRLCLLLLGCLAEKKLSKFLMYLYRS